MEIIVNSINQTYGENEQTNQVIVALSGNSTSGNGDYLSSSVNVNAKDLPQGKTFATMSAGALKALAKAQLVNDTKVAA
ncbi:hypothetical protein [Lactobacillus delbrueckii]|uniref:hypothetical protein n=1 Tax=Lactobacillus delbrueckii TaxID=1584 RepID=UPI001E33BE71|nr:hypothetical protein [Lactobacillus delbrueckii]MCD5571047.1 hypothetical protein [Lactobacillus delbrueckii subsp. lactis]